MRLLIATWEYPPYKIGGIGSHCYDLTRVLVKQGIDVHVLAYGDEEREEDHDGVTVHRIPCIQSPDTISWAMFLGEKMGGKAIELHKQEKFDLVHAHDWMMVPAGVGIKKTLNIPMVFTLHSTEHGRSGVHDSYTKMINDLEWYGTYEASQIITVGQDFCNEVRHLFRPPEYKLRYIPNGVDVSRFDDNKKKLDRNDYALDWEKIILFTGRFSHQKGVNHLIDAAPNVLSEHPEAKFVLTGRGSGLSHYQNIAMSKGLEDKMYFTGYVDESTLLPLFKAADVTVAPSVYEPFGIVALESGAASKPIVGSYVGGLKETIIHEGTGLHSYPCDPASIANELNIILSDDSWARQLGSNGRKRVEKEYNWNRIASWTTSSYEEALELGV